MCVLMASDGDKISLDWVQKAQKNNKDGMGMAWIENDQVAFEKSISEDRVMELMNAIDGPFLLHFRMASIGDVSPELCHPFPINAEASLELKGTAPSVMAHNGHWGKWKDFCVQRLLAGGVTFPEGDFSDTRAMAWLAYHCGENVLSLIDEKVVTLTPTGLKIYGGGWTLKDGVWLSNQSFLIDYLPGASGVGTYQNGWKDEDWDGYGNWQKENAKIGYH